MTIRDHPKRVSSDVLALALAGGATMAEAAADAGCSVSTVVRRLRDPRFVRLVEDRRQALVHELAGALTASGLSAVRALVTALDASSEAVRVRAAVALLEQAARYRELAWMEGRVTELESAVAGVSARDAS